MPAEGLKEAAYDRKMQNWEYKLKGFVEKFYNYCRYYRNIPPKYHLNEANLRLSLSWLRNDFFYL